MYAYNPRKKSPEQLERSLVGEDRRDILNSILGEMALEEGEGPKQHWMIIGPRGIGKSHLMTLLYHKIKGDIRLNSRWVPVLFPEELRMAGTLAKFLERAFNEILHEMEPGNDPVSDELKRKMERVGKTPISERADNYLSLISWFHGETGRFVVFIAENLQQLLGKKIPEIEQKKLRAFLQTSDALLIIGSATTIFDALHDHSHPFYHFFRLKRLQELTFGEMRTLIRDLLSEYGLRENRDESRIDDARLRTLYSFIGGNPRMAVFLADILKTEVPDEMLSLMDNILDQLTPYFDTLFNDCPASLEDVINTLAAFEPAQSPKEIAEHLEAPQATIRNYMKKLKESGYVRVAFSKGKSNYYYLSEYLYRVWWQMRDSSHREETRWLMELMLMLHSPGRIIDEKSKIEDFIREGSFASSYDKLIFQTADFIAGNPEFCHSIALCVDSTNNDNRSAIQQENELLKSAVECYDENLFDKSIEICRQIVEKHPESENSYKIWGHCLYCQGLYDEAIKKYKKAIAINPKSGETYGFWGICLNTQGLYDEAIKKYKKAIAINPKSGEIYGFWGICLNTQGLYDEAIKKYKKAIAINPKSGEIYGFWGICLNTQGLYDEAIEKFKKAIEINSKSDLIYGAWGICLYDQRLYEDANKKYKKAIEINPKSELHYGAWGNCLYDQGLYDEASEKYKKAIQIYPKFEKGYVLLGMCLIAMGRYEEAIDTSQKLVIINPKSKSANALWGLSLKQQGLYGEAIDKFNNEILVNPTFEPAFMHLMDCLYELGRFNEAIKIYDKYSSDCVVMESSTIHVYAKNLFEAKRYDEARAQFDRLIENEPEYCQAYLSYGQLLQRIGDNTAALFKYLMHMNSGCNAFSEVLEFQKILDEYVVPILDGLKPGELIKQFYTHEKTDGLSKKQLAVILALLGKYDILVGHIPDLLAVHPGKGINKDVDSELLVFVIKMGVLWSLCKGAPGDERRLFDLYIEYVKLLPATENKENEVTTFSIDLFKIQNKLETEPQNTRKILTYLNDDAEVPFNDIIFKIWTCLSEPDSVEAQRYLSDKGVEEVVTGIQGFEKEKK